MPALAGIAAIFCQCRDDPAAANPVILCPSRPTSPAKSVCGGDGQRASPACSSPPPAPRGLRGVKTNPSVIHPEPGASSVLLVSCPALELGPSLHRL